jgi:hypothetical protein
MTNRKMAIIFVIRELVIRHLTTMPEFANIARDITGNRVEGNFIGTDVTGNAALGNGTNGVTINNAPNNVIGGTTAGALGMTHHLAAVNVHMALYDRAGVRLGPHRRLRSLDGRLPNGVDDFDPKVVYDPYRHRFVLVFASANAKRSFLSIVMIPEGSEGSPNRWCVLHMSGDQVGGNGKQLADYPMIGFTEKRVTLTTNQFGYNNAPFVGRFQYVQVVSFGKGALYNCSVPVVPIKVFSRTQTRDPDGSRAFTIVPAISFGGAPATQFMTSMDFNVVYKTTDGFALTETATWQAASRRRSGASSACARPSRWWSLVPCHAASGKPVACSIIGGRPDPCPRRSPWPAPS